MFAPALALIRARLDRLGVVLSALCLIHCLSGVVLVTLLGIGGGVLLDPRVHQIGLALAIGVGAIGLGFGVARPSRHRKMGRRGPLIMGAVGLGLMAIGLVVPHGLPEVAATVPGVSLLALAHMRNLRHFA